MKKVIFIFLFISTIGVLFLNVTDEVRILSADNNVILKDSINDLSENVVGHIKIKGTNIDTYITKTSDNEYYLNHNYQDEKDINGSVFIDYRNNLGDKKLLIYGHNSNTEEYALFKDLEKYEDFNFYKDNSYIDITINNEEYKYKIFSVMIVKEGEYLHTKINFSEKEYLEHLNYLINNSIYKTDVSVLESDKIITLQTCNYNPKNSYLLVNARREK